MNRMLAAVGIVAVNAVVLLHNLAVCISGCFAAHNGPEVKPFCFSS